MSKEIKILILEDNEIFRKNFLELAKQHSFQVLGLSKTADELLKQIKEKDPEVVILDLVVPEENILELIQTIKGLYPDLPLIACSSLTEDHIVSKALKAGCFDYIFKPFKGEDLAQSIKSAVFKRSGL